MEEKKIKRKGKRENPREYEKMNLEVCLGQENNEWGMVGLGLM